MDFRYSELEKLSKQMLSLTNHVVDPFLTINTETYDLKAQQYEPVSLKRDFYLLTFTFIVNSSTKLSSILLKSSFKT